MITPPLLNPNDKISILCTARAVEVEDLAFALNVLKQWELVPVLGDTIGKQDCQFGGSDKLRIQDLQNAIDDAEIKAIWIAKGGYGTARILDHIDFSILKKYPKWIIGYSDITALHLHLQYLGLASLHAQMPVAIEHKSEETINSLKHSLFNKPYNISYTSSTDSIDGACVGELVGGNLSVLYSVLGTSSLPNFRDKILILEDLDEYLYHIDRMMLNLSRNGILKRIKGLIVGGMSDMKDNANPFGRNAHNIIRHYVSNLNIPVAFDFPLGHTFDNLAVNLGVKASLRVDGNFVSLKY